MQKGQAERSRSIEVIESIGIYRLFRGLMLHPAWIFENSRRNCYRLELERPRQVAVSACSKSRGGPVASLPCSVQSWVRMAAPRCPCILLPSSTKDQFRIVFGLKVWHSACAKVLIFQTLKAIFYHLTTLLFCWYKHRESMLVVLWLLMSKRFEWCPWLPTIAHKFIFILYGLIRTKSLHYTTAAVRGWQCRDWFDVTMILAWSYQQTLGNDLSWLIYFSKGCCSWVLLSGAAKTHHGSFPQVSQRSCHIQRIPDHQNSTET